ncbi:MAG: SUMF1/EgtB/PvdO family nonheme iron enzyme [Planctomycetia bacterium]|nr:SUMF1/EgtB/PvdO family nonheme iron enzyme [Planctomycetia bacterium]
MKEKGRIGNRGRRVVLGVLLSFGWMLGCDRGTQPCWATEASEPGTPREVHLDVRGKQVTIKMVYVPGQEGEGGVSGSSEASSKGLKQPFYFAVTELSLADFDALAPDDRRQGHDATEQTMAQQDEQKKDWAEMQRQAASYVAKMVSLDDAAAITAAATAAATAALAKSARSSSVTLASERFRLPTSAEWRHAMSMGSQPDKMYINPWPVFEHDLSEKDRGRCGELWTSCGGAGAFKGTPEQVVWLIAEASGNSEQRLELVTIFTRFLLNGRLLDPKKTNSYSWEVQPEPLVERIDAAPGNGWGIRGAHRGYPEWVLSATNQNDALGVWRRYESQAYADSDNQQQAFGLCGASSFTLNKLDLLPMLSAFVNHETPILDGVPYFSLQQAKDGGLHIDRSTSLRLVLVECLADEWAALVRSAFEDKKDAKSAVDVAKPLLAEIERLSFGSERVRYEAIINGYLAIAEYRCGAEDDAAARLASSATSVSSKTRSADDIAARFRRARGNAGSPTTPASSSPESVYLQAVARLMTRDQISVE